MKAGQRNTKQLIVQMMAIAALAILGPWAVHAEERTIDPFYDMPHLGNTGIPASKIFPNLQFAYGQTPTALPPMDGQGNGTPSVTDQTYTMFLFCREVHTVKQATAISQIHAEFGNFSKYLGQNNTAVWVGNDHPPVFDIETGKQLCDEFKLDYNGGPFVVYYRIRELTEGISERGGKRQNVKLDLITADLDHIKVDKIPTLLNMLQQYIRQQGSPADFRKQLKFEEGKQRFLSFFDYAFERLSEIVGKVKKVRYKGVEIEFNWEGRV